MVTAEASSAYGTSLQSADSELPGPSATQEQLCVLGPQHKCPSKNISGICEHIMVSPVGASIMELCVLGSFTRTICVPVWDLYSILVL